MNQESRAANHEQVDDIPEQMKVRREKRALLLADGRDPYPVSVPRTHEIKQIIDNYAHLEQGDETQDIVSVTGRVMFVRNTGKLCFSALQDGEGNRLQAMFSLKEVGEENLAQWKHEVDLGDIVSVTGRIISSKRGELSVMAREFMIATKALRPLPVLHREMNEETRVRQRYADLIVRQEAMRSARRRPEVVRSLRETLHSHDFVEVETPMLQTLHGGAAARPFVTRSNATDMELYLRIAPELFLKRAVIGGLDRVFEINRNFRNEGMDSTHSPEFAMLEFYQAYADYKDMAKLTRELIQRATVEAMGSTVVQLSEESEYDLGGEWNEVYMYPSLSDELGADITPETSVAELQSHADKLGLSLDPKHVNHGKFVEELWESTVGCSLTQPTFVFDFPVETSPLTKAHRDIDGVVEKWDLYVRGFELATGYSEMNDPVLQRERFEAQARLAAAGDDEAMAVDEDFLRALEYGMPPAGGVGMGIDRLLMTMTGQGIRETVLFPLVKPE